VGEVEGGGDLRAIRIASSCGSGALALIIFLEILSLDMSITM